MVKNPPADAGDIRDMGSIPGSGRSPREGHGNSLQDSRLENAMERSLEGYSPWGHKEWDRTEVTYTHAHSRGKGSEEKGIQETRVLSSSNIPRCVTM